MDNEQILHGDDDPPIYGEMKPVPVALESCILASDEGYPYSKTEDALITKNNCDDGELSAEEINSMIIINEGPNALSSVQEELGSSKVNLSLRNSSDIKKILTSDLPKTGRFLSTKSLQKLSGAKKVIKKNPKYENKTNDEVSDNKVKKVFMKQNKSVKENLDKLSQSKIVEHEIPKKNVKVEKLKMKSLKKGNSIEKLTGKKSLKMFKKIGVSKNKDLKSATKVFKKKVLESNSLARKEGILQDTELVPEKVISKPSGEKKKSKTENMSKLLISRSGRIRKIKDVSKEFVVSKSKEGKVSNPDGEMIPLPVVTDSDTLKQSEPVEDGSKFENGKENKSRGDLLQSALSESVESWFDIASGVEKKGKWTRARVKIIPRDSDACFEETRNSEVERDAKFKTEFETTDVKTENPENENKKIKDCKKVDTENSEKETVMNEEETDGSQSLNEVSIDNAENEENIKSDGNDQKLEVEETENAKKAAAANSKKSKSANRHVMAYTKKRRKVRNVTVSSYLKNYGEKIDFNIKLDPESEAKVVNIPPKNDDADIKEPKKESKKVGNDSEEQTKEMREPDEHPDVDSISSSEQDKTSPLKKSSSSENLKMSFGENISEPETLEESAEVPVSSVLEKNEPEKIEKDLLSNKKSEEFNSDEELTKTENGKINTEEISNRRNSKENLKVETQTLDSLEEMERKDSEVVDGTESQKKELNKEMPKVEKKIPQKRNLTLYRTKMFGMRRKRKSRALLRKEKTKSFKVEKEEESMENGEELNTKDLSPSEKVQKTEATEDKENGVAEESPNEISVPKVSDSLCDSPSLSIPFKKRPRRPKVSESLEEVGKDNKEGVNSSEKQDFERRKSQREIKLTPKIVDMIATSFSYKRFRKASISKDEGSPVVKEDLGSSNLTKKPEGGAESKTPAKETSFDQPVDPVPFVENYLQSKMEANASTFESSWEPGDLVWARFAGNPFWPSLIIRDPFSNDEYSRIRYLGRLPRPFVHVQFLADYGRRAWGPELYIMNFNGLDEFEKIKADLPEVNVFTKRKDLIYQQAFFAPKKMEENWMEAVKEGESLMNKSKDERITYMKIKYPLVKYAASVANGRLVPNERTKFGDLKSPLSRSRKRKSLANASALDGSSSDWSSKKSEETLGKELFECVNTSDLDEGIKRSEKASHKITLKLVRSPRKGSKRGLKSLDELKDKSIGKKMRKFAQDDDYVPSDSGSNGEKGPEVTSNKQKKYFLFKGARTEKVCQICMEILENEKTFKCKGPCQGLFHKSCAEKMSADLPPVEGVIKGVKNKRRKKLFADAESNNSTDAQSKDPTEKEWRCNDCLRGENPCFVCNSRSGNRQRCCIAYCGKFYHQKCLKTYPQTIYNQGAPIKKYQFLQQTKTAESESPHYQILSCPLHVCHTCASDNPADFNMTYLCEKLVKCIKCPSAYHGGNYCVPAGSKILNTSQIICAKHVDPKKKSHVNISWCFICNMGGSLICCEWCPSSFHLDCLNIKPPEGPYMCEECESGRFPLYGEVVWVKLGRYRWWPARILFPQEILPNIMALPHKPWEFVVRFYGSKDHYWLNRGRVFLYQEGDSEQKFKGQTHVDKMYQRAVQEATKDYFAIQEERKSRLLGTNSAGLMKPPPYVKIKTNKAVGKVQLGNASQLEPQTCDCDPNSEAPCSPGSDCLNRMLLVECNPNYCNAGSRCWNQSFEKREYPPLEPYRTERRGWGLRSSIDLPKGSFIIEYVGEVVDDEEFKRRMKRKQETKDINYYFLTIDKDRMIDAGPKGNLARFMNHSCSPNCETQKWTVNGDTRVGLFALRDIPAGTELTFNYNLDCIGNEKKVCHCEEENCSGFIGVKAKNDKSDAMKNKMAKRAEKESEDECFVCSDGGELMVCDDSNCPKVYHLQCVNLTEWPNESWFCPRHRCYLCSKTTKRCCKLCPTAYCFAHLDNNMFPDNQGGLLCSKHSTCAVKPAQTLRKASYVNRNTPVVEYEKPFTEKYRPPPPKERNSPPEKTGEILMEPNLTDNTPIVVENPLLSPATPSRLSDGVSVQVLYVDEEGQIISVDESASGLSIGEGASSSCEREAPKPLKRKKRTNIPRKKLNPGPVVEETGNKAKSPTPGGINFESLMIKSVEDKILDSKLNMDNIYNIIGGGGRERDAGHAESDSAERCVPDDGNDLKPETVNKKEDPEVDRSRRSKYFKIVTPEKFIKVSESESNQKKVTDFNYIEFMHPLRSARSKSKTDENTRK